MNNVIMAILAAHSIFWALAYFSGMAEKRAAEEERDDYGMILTLLYEKALEADPDIFEDEDFLRVWDRYEFNNIIREGYNGKGKK